MRLLYKTRSYLADNSGETIVEVLVAFTLLAILLVLFTQGITFATLTEARARKMRESSDNAMIKLQEKLSSGEDAYKEKVRLNNVSSNVLYRYEYEIDVDGNIYTYYVYKPQ